MNIVSVLTNIRQLIVCYYGSHIFYFFLNFYQRKVDVFLSVFLRARASILAMVILSSVCLSVTSR